LPKIAAYEMRRSINGAASLYSADCVSGALVPFYLVAREDDEVRGFGIEDAFQEFEGAEVSLAVRGGLVIVRPDGVEADGRAGGEVGVTELDDLEFAVFTHTRLGVAGLFVRFGIWTAVAGAQSCDL